MRLRGSDKLADFAKEFNDAKNALDNWTDVIEAATWKNRAELKATFGSASFVDGKTVFNIRGNKYRLICSINYELETVLVTHILTHKEYDKDKWK